MDRAVALLGAELLSCRSASGVGLAGRGACTSPGDGRALAKLPDVTKGAIVAPTCSAADVAEVSMAAAGALLSEQSAAIT